MRRRSYLSLRTTAHLAARLVGGRRSGFVCVARGRNQGRQTIVNSRKRTGEEGEERREGASRSIGAQTNKLAREQRGSEVRRAGESGRSQQGDLGEGARDSFLTRKSQVPTLGLARSALASVR